MRAHRWYNVSCIQGAFFGSRLIKETIQFFDMFNLPIVLDKLYTTVSAEPSRYAVLGAKTPHFVMKSHWD